MAVLVGYVRVSGEGQRDNNSLPVQRQEIESFCLRKGHTLFTVLEDVESGESAEERQGLQTALNLVYANLADGLIVHKLDRLARNVLDSETIRLDLKKRDKQLVSIIDPVDTSSDSGKMTFQILSSVAEFEKDRIKKRCTEGRERKRKNGGYIGGRPPYGYQATGRNLVVNEKEQEIIRLIREFKATCKNLAEVAHKLNSQGYRMRTGKPWGVQSIYAIAKING